MPPIRLTLILLLALSGPALAQDCDRSRACTEGTEWNPDTARCEPVSS
ncbi:hypothetical protein [Gemmobacter caeruleus]|nr:hypothetical protein [Gemmobacter caeruleus]